MSKGNQCNKEYVTGRQDQFNVDYAIFRKCVKETQGKDDLIKAIEEKFSYFISHITSERVKDLPNEMELF